MINKCIFIGRLGADVESRYTKNGKHVATFRVAVSEKFGGSEHTEWISCVAWEKLAEICANYLHKGSLVYVCGRMQTRKWQDQSGNDRYTTEIILSEMQMLDKKSSNDEQGGWYKPPTVGDDVPF